MHWRGGPLVSPSTTLCKTFFTNQNNKWGAALLFTMVSLQAAPRARPGQCRPFVSPKTPGGDLVQTWLAGHSLCQDGVACPKLVVPTFVFTYHRSLGCTVHAQELLLMISPMCLQNVLFHSHSHSARQGVRTKCCPQWIVLVCAAQRPRGQPLP